MPTLACLLSIGWKLIVCRVTKCFAAMDQGPGADVGAGEDRTAMDQGPGADVGAGPAQEQGPDARRTEMVDMQRSGPARETILREVGFHCKCV